MPIIDAGIILAITGLIGAFAKIWFDKRKSDADAGNARADAENARSEAEKHKAEAEKARAERDQAQAAVMQNLTDAMNNLLAPLNQQNKELRAEIVSLRDRVRSLENTAGAQGQELIQKDLDIEKLRSEKDREIAVLTTQVESMRCEVQALKGIIDDYRSGRRKPTGPLVGQ